MRFQWVKKFRFLNLALGPRRADVRGEKRGGGGGGGGVWKEGEKQSPEARKDISDEGRDKVKKETAGRCGDVMERTAERWSDSFRSTDR